MPSLPRLSLPTAVVLYCVAQGFRHGFDIIDVSGLRSGTVYPILRRLEDAGILTSKWERIDRARAEQRPPRRIYQLTGTGAEALEEAIARFPGVARMLKRPRGTPRPLPA
jgi:PadR family transcriptional regulator, regulatory protein PadR